MLQTDDAITKDLVLRKNALGELAGDKTGYASTEKPWLKYYSEDDIRAKLMEKTAYQALVNESRNYLDDIAFHYYGLEVSFKELIANINTAADAYASIGVIAGDTVMISSLTIPEIIYSFYALNIIGAIPNMVDPRTSVEGINHYCNEAKAKYFVTLDQLTEKITLATQNTDVGCVITIDPTNALEPVGDQNDTDFERNGQRFIAWRKLISMSIAGAAKEKPYIANDCCVIVHTGGTTGNPKSVMLSNDNLNAAAHLAIHSPLQLKRKDSFLNLMPPFISYGVVIGLHTALIEGWKSIIIPQFELSQFDQLVLQYKPNGIMGVPAYFEILMNSPKVKQMDLSFIKAVLIGGDNTSEEFEKKINSFFAEHNCSIHVSKGYSMTEASASGTLSYENANKYGSAGIPMVKTVISSFDIDTGEELPLGEAGELCINTPTIMIGYYNNQLETDKILKTHKDGTRWIHSGDLGYVDNDGFIFIEGRLKRVIIRHDGFKVFPTQIENAVISHPGITAACAVAVRDQDHSQGSFPLVYVVIHPDYMGLEHDIKEQLSELCHRNLPEYSQPVDYKFIDALPLTPIGKIDYRALEKLADEKPQNE